MLIRIFAPHRRRPVLALAALLLALVGLAVLTLDRRQRGEPSESGTEIGASDHLRAEAPSAQPDPAVIDVGVSAAVALLAPDRTTTSAVVPHRAPEAQRQQDRQRMQDDPDLGAYAKELKARADSGDADAAMALSDLFASCSRASSWRLTDSGFRAEISDYYRILGLGDEQFSRLEATQVSLGIRCAQWSQMGSSERLRAAESWAASAAAMGHPGAQLSAISPLLRRDPPPADAFERARQAGLELLAQRDPLDLIRHMLEFSALSPYESGAFAMAACQMNPVCGADPQAYARGHLADGWFHSGENYQRLIYLAPRDRWIAELQAAEIASLWRAGRFDLILPNDRSSSGGGG